MADAVQNLTPGLLRHKCGQTWDVAGRGLAGLSGRGQERARPSRRGGIDGIINTLPMNCTNRM
eukprot:6491584-Amphidinium_carterae.1